MKTSSQNVLPLRKTVITPDARRSLHPEDVQAALKRHAQGDWKVCLERDEESGLSFQEDFQLLSAYRDRNQMAFWVITETDRNVTTILLPEEF